MGAIATQITSLTNVYSTVYSGGDQSKHQSSASLALVWGFHRWPVNSPHKGPVTRKMFSFDDAIMSGSTMIIVLWWGDIIPEWNDDMMQGYIMRRVWLPHDYFMIWSRFPHYLSFMRGVHQSSLDSPQKRLHCYDVSMLLAWKLCCTTSRVTGDLRRHDAHVTSLQCRGYNHCLKVYSTLNNIDPYDIPLNVWTRPFPNLWYSIFIRFKSWTMGYHDLK